MIHYKLFSFVFLEYFLYLCIIKLIQTYYGKNDQNIRAHGASPSVLSQALPRGSLAQTPSVDHPQSGSLTLARPAPTHIHARRGTVNLCTVRGTVENRVSQEIRLSYFWLSVACHTISDAYFICTWKMPYTTWIACWHIDILIFWWFYSISINSSI